MQLITSVINDLKLKEKNAVDAVFAGAVVFVKVDVMIDADGDIETFVNLALKILLEKARTRE